MPQQGAIGLPDDELARQLVERDGSFSLRFLPHMVDGACRLASLYPDQPCLWCEAELQRRQAIADLGRRRRERRVGSAGKAAA